MSTSLFPLLLEAELLATHLENPNILIVDMGSIENHMRFHLPKAIHLPYEQLVCNRPPAPGLLPTRDQLEDALAHIGYSHDKHIVAYDDVGGCQATRLLWTLDLIGHHSMSLLNGGLHYWLAQNLPLSQEIHHPAPTDVELPSFTDVLATQEYILEHLNDPNVKLWDSRSEDEYKGYKIAALKAGHIPNAINLNWQNLIDQTQDMKLISVDVIQAQLAQLGMIKSHEIITYCQTHRRSAFTYFILKLLGYPHIKGYAGSWSEWGNSPITPVEQ